MVESLRRRAGRFGLDIILVNLWESAGAAAEDAARYCQMWGIEATVLLDEEAHLARAAGVRGVPTNVFVDERGIVQAVGASRSEELLRLAAHLEPKLLGELEHVLGADRLPSNFAAGRRSG